MLRHRAANHWLAQEPFQCFIFTNTSARPRTLPSPFSQRVSSLPSPYRNSVLLPSDERVLNTNSVYVLPHSTCISLGACLMPAGSSFPTHLVLLWQICLALPTELQAVLRNYKRPKPWPRQTPNSNSHTQLTSWCLLFWQLFSVAPDLWRLPVQLEGWSKAQLSLKCCPPCDFVSHRFVVLAGGFLCVSLLQRWIL